MHQVDPALRALVFQLVESTSLSSHWFQIDSPCCTTATYSKAYSILSDPKKRKFYDESGDVEDIDVSAEDFIKVRCVVGAS